MPSSSSKSRLFEPCYIWKSHEETKDYKSGQKLGVLSRMLGLKTEEMYEKDKCFGNCQEVKDHNHTSPLKLNGGSVLKIANSKNGMFTFDWRNKDEKIKNLEISETDLPKLFTHTLEKCNYQIGELFLDLKKGSDESALSLSGCRKISVRKLYLRLESLSTLEWWLCHVSADDISGISIAPFGDQPNDIPCNIFDYPHFRKCRTLCLMEQCSFTSEQFLSICTSVPHFSFYSDTVCEAVVKSAIEERVNSTNVEDFVVLEWFFARHVKTGDVIQDLVRPHGDRRERFSHQKQCFEPVDVYSVSNENNKKLSVMIVEDFNGGFKPYSLVLFS